MDENNKQSAFKYLFDELNEIERQDFETHMKMDPELKRYVFELQEVEESLVRSMRSTPLKENVLSVIENTILHSKLDKPKLRARWYDSSFFSGMGWGVAAMLLFGIFYFSFVKNTEPVKPYVVVYNLKPGQSEREIQTLEHVQNGESARFYAMSSIAEAKWRSWEKRPKNTQSEFFTVFEPSTQQGFIGFTNLPDYSESEVIYLWLYDEVKGTYRKAGALPASNSRKGMYAFDMPSDTSLEGKVAAQYRFLLTIEDVGAISEKPKGRIVAGKNTTSL